MEGNNLKNDADVQVGMIIFAKFYTYEGYGEEEINESRDEIVLYHPDANITMEARLEIEYKLYIQRR